MTGKPNRQQRRAAERRRARPDVGMVRIHDLTIPEADLLAEALDAFVQMQARDLGEPDATWPVEAAWARARALQMREMLQAAVDGRPVPHDGRGDRAPEVLS